jgi:hypothetical protein
VIGLVVVAECTPSFRWKQFDVGFVVGSLVMAATGSLVRVWDPRVHGQWAEEWSVEALHKVRGWLITDNLPFDNVDVDHVAVAPSTVLAIETKYRSRPPHPSYAGSSTTNDIRAAQAAADKLRRFLLSKGLRDAASVTPILMIWGAGAPDMATGWERRDDVWIVDGTQPKLWSHLFNAPRVPVEARLAIHQALTEFVHSRQDYEARRAGRQRRTLLREVLAGAREARQERAHRRAAVRSMARRHARRR